MPKSKEIFIGGQAIRAKTEFQVNLNIARLPSRTPIDIPIFVSSGKTTEPILLLLAGLHGDEINGIEIVRRLLDQGLNKPLKGTTICIPVLNVYGFLNFSRVPDGKDVNRSFPGSAKGSLASRVAYHLMHDIVSIIDCGIDFHTGGASRNNIPQIRCHIEDRKSRKLAEAFSPHFIINSNSIPKSLRHTAAQQKKPILIYEAGESLRLEEEAIKVGMRGARRVMKHLGMIRSHHRPKKPTQILSKMKWVRARNSGIFHSSIKNGVLVDKGQVLGFITDPFGDFKTIIKSPSKAYTIALNHNPIVNQGDALVHLGLP